jgi:hypothetical protein
MIKLQKVSIIVLASVVIILLASFDRSETKRKAPNHSLAYAHYRIIYGKDVWELESSINSQIKNGWEPAGGIVVGKDGFYQAIVK